MINHVAQEQFLHYVKVFIENNANLPITYQTIYSLLVNYNSKYAYTLEYGNDIEPLFTKWENHFKKVSNISVSKRFDSSFCHFSSNKINSERQETIKLYVPLKEKHMEKGIRELFRFLAASNIDHTSMVSRYIRNDNVIIRLKDMIDVYDVISYISSNPYLMTGLNELSPFTLPYNGLGITADNSKSYNSHLAKLIFEYVQTTSDLKSTTLDGFNAYVENARRSESNRNFKIIDGVIVLATKTNKKQQKVALDDQGQRYEANLEKAVLTIYSHSEFLHILYTLTFYLAGSNLAFKDVVRNTTYLSPIITPAIVRKIIGANVNKEPNDISIYDISNYIKKVLMKYNYIKKENSELNTDPKVMKKSILYNACLETLTKFGVEHLNMALLYYCTNSHSRLFTNDNQGRDLLMDNLSPEDTIILIREMLTENKAVVCDELRQDIASFCSLIEEMSMNQSFENNSQR